jgi:hypothetical protein
LWHKANIVLTLMKVRFRGYNGHHAIELMCQKRTWQRRHAGFHREASGAVKSTL